MKHYGPQYAVLLCRLIGHREPLIARLRDPAIPRTQHEMEYLADVLAKPERWSSQKTVDKSREKLRRAGYYLEFLWKGGSPGKTMAAQEHVVRKCRVNLSTVRRSVDYAKDLGGGEWWRSTERLAKKGLRKRASLRRTY
jgi:hypothetical protein